MKIQTFPKRYFGYIRVSTVRQGQTGTSLIEQRSAIEQYAFDSNLPITNWFEERETAAKQGRPVFRKMITDLRQEKASGVIIYKIDRSARNLRDWAELGELIDAGIDVRFASEQLDLDSRGGRLSADIQAVIAADFIRNLREETKRGFYARINQGFYPMPAPLGYLNSGGGKRKEIDPITAPFIKKIFKCYATGKFCLRTVAAQMNIEGLRNRNEGVVSMRGIAHVLHNPFYTGIVRIKTLKEYVTGQHLPLISKALFDAVQMRLKDKTTRKSSNTSLREAFLFRKLLTCAECTYRLIAEKQKGYIYYRCQKGFCLQKTIREEVVVDAFLETLGNLHFSKKEAVCFQEQLSYRRRTLGEIVEGKINTVETTERAVLKESESAFRFVQSAYLEYSQASYARKREIISRIAANIQVKGKVVLIQLHDQFETLQKQKNNL